MGATVNSESTTKEVAGSLFILKVQRSKLPNRLYSLYVCILKIYHECESGI